MNVADLVQAEAIHYRGAITDTQAVILACAKSDGSPLDPHISDDAALLIRAEQLIAAGAKVRAAIAHARQELREAGHHPRVAQQNGNGTTPSCSLQTLPAPPAALVCNEPNHRRLWAARDGRWRCDLCEPPHFAGEIVARTEVRP